MTEADDQMLNPIGEKYSEVVLSYLEPLEGRQITPELIVGLCEVLRDVKCEFVGGTEASEILGVSRQRVNKLTSMPGEAGRTLVGPFWLKKDIEQFASQREDIRQKHMGIPKGHII